MKKKILMVVKNTFELDNRVFRAADALAGQGHEVLLLAYHRDGLKRCETLGAGFRLRRIQLYGRDYGRRGRVYNMLKFGVFLKKAKLIVDRFKPDIVHCHDYNTLDVGLYARRKHGAGLVYDCHEYFQDLGYLKRYPMILRVLVAAYERWAVRRVDRMIVVSPGIARAYKKLSPRQLTVVRNIPSHPTAGRGCHPLPGRLAEAMTERESERVKRLLYLGRSVFRARGIGFMFDLLYNLPADFRLVIVGIDAEKEQEKIMAGATAHQVGEKVVVFGTEPLDRLLTMGRYFSFGLSIVEPVTLSYKHCLPNKFFEYIAMGLPVVSSDIPEQKAIVRRYGNGLVLDTNDAAASARRLARYTVDKASVKAAQGHFTWEMEKMKLGAVYAGLGPSRPVGRCGKRVQP